MKNMLIAIVGVTYIGAVAAMGAQPEILSAIEYSLNVEYDNMEELESLAPTLKSKDPVEFVKERYQLTDAMLLENIIALSMKYTPSETNAANRSYRRYAIDLIGRYGCATNLEYLSSIWRNTSDYAREQAIQSTLSICSGTTNFIATAREALLLAGNGSGDFQNHVYLTLYEYWRSDDNKASAQNASIAHFFLESAATCGWNLFVDRCACEMNPSYRHSQARRDNLSRNRPPNLTGEQAEIYDARQRDAMEPEE